METKEEDQANAANLLPCPTQTVQKAQNDNGVQMFDHTLPRSKNLSSITGMGVEPNLRLLRQSPSIFSKTKNLPVKRKLSPSSYTWQRSMRLKRQERKEAKEAQVIEEGLTTCQDTFRPKVGLKNVEEGDLVEGHRLPLKQMEKGRVKGGSLNPQICHGMDELEFPKCPRTPAASKQQISSANSTETSNQPNCILDLHLEHQEESQCLNGNTFSKEKPSTLIKSSCHSTVLQLIQRERLALETQKSVLADLKRKGRLKRVLNGLPHGDPLREPLLLFLNTGAMNWPITVTISSVFLPQKGQDPMAKSSYSTGELETKSEEDKQYCSPTIITSPPFMQPRCRMMESSTEEAEEEEVEDLLVNQKPKFASGSTVLEGAALPSPHASSGMIVKDVAKRDMANHLVRKGIEEEVFGLKPRYLRHNLWSTESDPKVTAAEWTCQARALPRPPSDEWENESVLETLKDRSDLFEIVSPVNVGVLRKLTIAHPNQPFVESVLNGLEKGFWPWATTTKEGYPLTNDESRKVELTAEKEEFVLAQVKHEQELDRMSASFGKDLLPGMYCMPQYVVPKPHTNDWRLVNDLSAGPFSLNSMINRRFITGFPLDNLTQFGELLIRRMKESPGLKFVAWKSDISEAYRICPMHELWQVKQVVRVKGELLVDRVNVFGGSGSGPIFISVNSLVAWVAKHEREVDDLVYVDDSFGVEESGKESFYPPYGEAFPTQQAKLLELWDKLGIPHKHKKQVNGTSLLILGILVDMEKLTFTLPEEARERLLNELWIWSQRGVRKKVKEWQQLAGWVNWALNVYPLLRPALNNVYSKIKGKEQDSRVWANNAIREDLEWARNKVEKSEGVRLLKSLAWDVSEATCTAMTDACPRGFAFWYPELNLGFTTSTPSETTSNQITFYETLAVFSVLDNARLLYPPGSKIVIYTDNFSAVAMYNSFRALPEYNCILKASVDILYDFKFDLRVLHVAGVDNDVADALSRGEIMRAIQINPKLTIKAFDPYQRVNRRQSTPLLRPPRQPLGVPVC